MGVGGGGVELGRWRPIIPHLGDNQVGNVTCGMVVGQGVGNSIQVSGMFTLNSAAI